MKIVEKFKNSTSSPFKNIDFISCAKSGKGDLKLLAAKFWQPIICYHSDKKFLFTND